MSALTLITPPALEPVTLVEAKAHLRVESAQDDTLITALIVAARQSAEIWLGRALITQTWRLLEDAAPEGRFLELPRAPLLSVTHVKSYDDTDAATIFPASAYFVDTARQPGRVVLRVGAVWPTVSRAANGFEVQFAAGYGPAASDVPAAIRQGLLIHLASLYAARGDRVAPDGRLVQEDLSVLPATAFALYAPYRLLRLG